MALALQDYRSYVRLYFDLDEEDLPDLLVDAWCREGQFRILRERRDWQHLEQTIPLPIAASTAVYAVPGLRTIVHVEHPTYGRLRRLEESSAEDRFFVADIPSIGNPQAYSIWGNELQIWPVPQDSATLQVRGYRAPVQNWTSAGAGATPDLPEDFQDALLEWVMHKAYLHQDDPELGAMHLQTFADVLQVLLREENEGHHDGPVVLGGSRRSGNREDGTHAGNPFLYPWN